MSLPAFGLVEIRIDPLTGALNLKRISQFV